MSEAKSKTNSMVLCVQRYPLLRMLLAIAGALVLCLLSALSWYNSDADVERVRVALDASGVRENISGPVSDQWKLDLMDEIDDIVKNNEIRDFASSTYYEKLNDQGALSVIIKSWDGDPELEVGDDIPDELRIYYAQYYNQAAHDIIIRCIKKLNGAPIRSESEWGPETNLNYVTQFHSLVLSFSERALTLSVDDFNKELVMLYTFAQCMPEGPLISADIKVGILIKLNKCVTMRLPDVNTELLGKMRVAQTHMLHFFRRSVQVSAAFNIDIFKHMPQDEWFNMHYGHKRQGFHERWLAQIESRYYRETCLTYYLELAVAARRSYVSFKKKVKDFKSGETYDKVWRIVGFYPWREYINQMDQYLLSTDVLIAVLAKKTLPLDSYGQKLIEIYDAKGALMGYYSIGENGIDDGWENEDPIWIYGTLAR